MIKTWMILSHFHTTLLYASQNKFSRKILEVGENFLPDLPLPKLFKLYPPQVEAGVFLGEAFLGAFFGSFFGDLLLLMFFPF
jgi:hypothetical protein